MTQALALAYWSVGFGPGHRRRFRIASLDQGAQEGGFCLVPGWQAQTEVHQVIIETRIGVLDILTLYIGQRYRITIAPILQRESIDETADVLVRTELLHTRFDAGDVGLFILTISGKNTDFMKNGLARLQMPFMMLILSASP